ncbi:MAG: hypothetical protein K2Q22_03850, partial [Cytophagales bacterium]|nr:hypothetical protein [Cytophagales bacterium]
MKYISNLPLFILGIFLAFTTQAEKNYQNRPMAGGKEVFTADAILMNIGLGIPSFQTPYSNNLALPKLSVALEFGVHKWVSVGGFLAFNYWASKGEDAFNRYEITQPDFLLGAKGSFHFSAIGKEKWNWNI